MCLESVFGALGGWLVLRQSLSARELAGCALIFAAVVLAQLPVGDWLRGFHTRRARHDARR
jgi:drug/metabolite transporter (DMT)-like permease